MCEYSKKNSFKILQSRFSKTNSCSVALSYSSCFSFAWIDFLLFKNLDVMPFQKGQPQIPSLIISSGDGSQYSPFAFDISDPLIKCFSEIFGPKWFVFLASVNANLRNIDFKTSYFSEVLEKAQDYIFMMQCVGIGIGRSLPIGGIKLQLVMIPPKLSKDIARPALLVENAANDYKTLDSSFEGLSVKEVIQQEPPWIYFRSRQSWIYQTFRYIRSVFFQRTDSKSMMKLRILFLFIFLITI